jgi:hypothetical protein
MDVIEKLTELLTGKTFSHNGKEYCFLSCKKVVSNIMILTNKETLQIPVDSFINFYEKVEKNCFDASNLPQKQNFVPTQLPVKNLSVFMPEMSSTYQKLNKSFDNLIDQIDSATDENIAFLESKAKMLTSVAQTAIGMENSRVNLIKIFQGK